MSQDRGAKQYLPLGRLSQHLEELPGTYPVGVSRQEQVLEVAALVYCQYTRLRGREGPAMVRAVAATSRRGHRSEARVSILHGILVSGSRDCYCRAIHTTVAHFESCQRRCFVKSSPKEQP